MYISKIYLENIRCFKDLTLELKQGSTPLLWATILGDNAVGKSTILKCIAMGLCDETSAGALMKESNGEFLRKGELSGKIEIYLNEKDSHKEKVISTTITKSNADSPERLRQDLPHDILPWEDIFFCGYGVHISEGGGEGFDKYKPLEAVYTLFKNGSDLQNPEVIMLRQDKKFRTWLSDKLLEILMLEGYNIEYTNKGMFITGPWGKFRISELSDGYRNTTQWIVDFFGWAINADMLVNEGDEIEGILLLDELETHLHPKWQRYIVDRLRKQLPKVQFIITTHSPIIALGTSDLEEATIIELELETTENNVIHREVNPSDYKGLTVDQILTSSAFKLPIARSGNTGDTMLAFRSLFMKDKRTPAEEEKLLELKEKIKSDIPEAGESESDRKLRRELKETLKELNEKFHPKINDKTKT